MSQLNVHLKNGDFITTDMYYDVIPQYLRIQKLKEAIREEVLVEGVYHTTLGSMRTAKVLISENMIVAITTN
jgi:hypothetical protein